MHAVDWGRSRSRTWTVAAGSLPAARPVPWSSRAPSRENSIQQIVRSWAIAPFFPLGPVVRLPLSRNRLGPSYVATTRRWPLPLLPKPRNCRNPMWASGQGAMTFERERCPLSLPPDPRERDGPNRSTRPDRRRPQVRSLCPTDESSTDPSVREARRRIHGSFCCPRARAIIAVDPKARSRNMIGISTSKIFGGSPDPVGKMLANGWSRGGHDPEQHVHHEDILLGNSHQRFLSRSRSSPEGSLWMTGRTRIRRPPGRISGRPERRHSA